MKQLTCVAVTITLLLAAGLLLSVNPALSQIPTTYPTYQFDTVAHHKNVREVSYINTEPSLKMDLQVVNGKWYLYLAHYWDRHGWTVVDVTDPKTPKIVDRIYVDEPYAASTDTTQIAVANGIMITSLERMQGMTGPALGGVYTWDVKTDPAHPKRLAHWHTGKGGEEILGTHRVTYFGGDYAHVAAEVEGYKGDIYIILNVKDPQHPYEEGRWWVPGQKTGETAKAPASTALHGAMAEKDANGKDSVAYLAYQGAGVYMLDITTPSAPKVISNLSFSPPFKSSLGTHSAYPLPGTYNVFPYENRKLVFANGEGSGEGCQQALDHTSIIDITDPTKPTLVSLMPQPVPPEGAPYNNFCEKWGRTGPHNTNDLFLNPWVQKSHNLAYVTWFNAGVRIFDISDPRLPVEVGYYIPPNPLQKLSPILPKTALVTQSQYGLVDIRGYMYLTDWNQGMYILQYTGPMKDNP